MTEAGRQLAGLVAAGLLLLLAGCSDDPTLLDTDALPSDVSSSDGGSTGFPSVTSCEALTNTQSSLATTAWAADGFQYWTYHLDSGETTGAAVLDFRDEDQLNAAVDEISAAIDTCAAEPRVGIEVTALDDLPDGVIGYSATQPFNDTEQRGTTVFGPAEGDRLVVVRTSRTDGTDPEADVVALLADAQDRVADLDELPKKDQNG
jgi:hypothetical protein